MSTYWTSIYDEDDRLRDLERLEPGVVFAWLNANLSAIGTAVDWDRVSGEHTHWFAASDSEQADIVGEFLAAVPLGDQAVLHEGDSSSPFPVSIERGNLPSALAALLEIPEHHYLVDEQHGWVGVFRTEGDVDLVVFESGPDRMFAEDE
jgi:fido (protein-threonine AMPylation protein)